jgi:hypothetical protein
MIKALATIGILIILAIPFILIAAAKPINYNEPLDGPDLDEIDQ